MHVGFTQQPLREKMFIRPPDQNQSYFYLAARAVALNQPAFRKKVGFGLLYVIAPVVRSYAVRMHVRANPLSICACACACLVWVCVLCVRLLSPAAPRLMLLLRLLGLGWAVAVSRLLLSCCGLPQVFLPRAEMADVVAEDRYRWIKIQSNNPFF